ncbi:MAG: ABC transporter [Alphaproteobacteria bacterium]|nr:ABC transporter [Alphaproteobacteria bacterium]
MPNDTPRSSGGAASGVRPKGLSARARRSYSWAALAAAVVLFLAVNVLSNAWLRTGRADLTQGKLYTLSEGTKEILGRIEEPITLRLYFSPRLGREIPLYANYHQRVRDLLDEYASRAGGKINLEFYDPAPYSDVEDRAVAYRLQGVPLEAGGEQVFFGMAGTNSTDDEEILPFFQPERERFLEYDLSKVVFNLANPKRREVGLISQLPITGDVMPMQGMRMPQPWVVMDQMRQIFQVRQFGGDTGSLPKDLQILMLVHPKELSEEGQYAIDQFVLRGGKLLVFVDPNSEADASRPSRDPNAMPGPTSSNPQKLFDAWGVELVKDRVIGDRLTATRVNAGTAQRPRVTDYIVWNGFKAGNLNRQDAVTGELQLVNVASAGILKPIPGAATAFVPLVTASPGAMMVETDKIKFAPDPTQLLKDYKAESEILTMVARITGPAKTAFPDGPPKVEGRPQQPDLQPHVAESQGPISVIIVADTDMLEDRFWVSAQEFFGQRVVQPSANNGDFVVNALENLAGGGDLMSLRSRGISSRPFELVQDIQRDAERRFRSKERELQDKLKETEKKLSDLQTKEQSTGATILSADQQKAIEDARKEILTLRRELRLVQNDLRKDIDRLEAMLRVVNIGLIPILVALVAVGLGIFRIARRRQRATALS